MRQEAGAGYTALHTAEDHLGGAALQLNLNGAEEIHGTAQRRAARGEQPTNGP